MGKAFLLATVLLVFLVPGAGLVVCSYPHFKWTGAYSRIELGMTLPQVEAAVGFPPGIYEESTAAKKAAELPPLRERGIPHSPILSEYTLKYWIGRYYIIWVIFDERGAAVGTYLLKAVPDDPDLLDKGRDYVKKWF